MRNILFIILFATGLFLTSCSKGGGGDNPQPVKCEQGGQEVTP